VFNNGNGKFHFTNEINIDIPSLPYLYIGPVPYSVKRGETFDVEVTVIHPKDKDEYINFLQEM